MAAYFHGGAGTDIQASADGLQTLYLMNPSYAGYADAAATAPNMMLLNSAMGSVTPATFGNQPPPAAQHFVGVPLQPPTSGYSLWAPVTTGAADMSPPQQSPGAAVVSAVLSLSSRETPPVTVAAVAATEGKYAGSASSLKSAQGQLVMNSKYLKVAQELLDEVVSVSMATDEAKAAAAKSAASVKKKEDSEDAFGGGGGEDGGGDKIGGAAAELSTAERQELQMKKGKLVNMLDEVEQRYRQYHQQMQVVAASFEEVAGAGSARTYTALALRTISRQFRCLRDAIAAQVRAASRGLGEEGAADGKTMGSRLRYIDHQIRQQRALQQLGMMQSSAWRPQRGLPERSVSILRAWLFEHFLHPYPKDSDKIMLAKQTGLTRSQVSNWFINARVRLWKPMVEEMYLEETKDQDGNDMDPGGADDNSGGSKSNNNDNAQPPKPDMSSATTTKANHVASVESSRDVHAPFLEHAGEQQSQGISFYDNDGGALQPKLKRARTDEPPAFQVSNVATLHHAAAAAAAAARRDEVSHRELLMKFMECDSGAAAAASARDHRDGGYSLFTPAYGQFGSDHFAFSGNSGVSLTLGLPPGAAEQTASFLMSSSNTGDGDNHGVTAVTAAASGYDMNMQSTKSFAAQLMRDFVA